MYQYRNAVFISNTNIKKIKSGVINFASQKNLKKIFVTNIIHLFYEHSNIEEGDE